MANEAAVALLPMAVCESCWLEDHAHWQPESVDSTGNVLVRLVGVDVPIKINSESVEVCCMCGALTISGIYGLKDPKKIYFTDNGDKKYELDIDSFDVGDDFD